MADYNGTNVCIFVAMMTTKRMVMYEKVFNKLKEECPFFKPAVAMMDFERALQMGFIAVFPDCRVNGCR